MLSTNSLSNSDFSSPQESPIENRSETPPPLQRDPSIWGPQASAEEMPLVPTPPLQHIRFVKPSDSIGDIREQIDFFTARKLECSRIQDECTTLEKRIAETEAQLVPLDQTARLEQIELEEGKQRVQLRHEENEALRHRLGGINLQLQELDRDKQDLERQPAAHDHDDMSKTQTTLDPIAVRTRVDEMLAVEYPKLITLFDDRLREEGDPLAKAIETADNELVSLKSEVAKMNAMTENISIQISTEVESAACSKIEEYNHVIRLKLKQSLEQEALDFETAKVSFQSQLDQSETVWSAKLNSLQMAIQAANTREHDLVAEQAVRKRSGTQPRTTSDIEGPRIQLDPSSANLPLNGLSKSDRWTENLVQLSQQYKPNAKLNVAGEADPPPSDQSANSSTQMSLLRRFSALRLESANESVPTPRSYVQTVEENLLSTEKSTNNPNSGIAVSQFLNSLLSRKSGLQAVGNHKPTAEQQQNAAGSVPQRNAANLAFLKPSLPGQIHPAAVENDVDFRLESPRQRLPVARGGNDAYSHFPHNRRENESFHKADLSPSTPNHTAVTSPSRPVKSREFLLPRKEQARDASLNPVKKAIRKLMQNLLNISSDRLIIESVQIGSFTTLEQSQAYIDRVPGAAEPTLEPFHPCWEEIHGPWNIALEELFLERFKREHAELSKDESYIRQHFRQRLETIRGQISVNLRKLSGENTGPQMSSKSRKTERRRMVYHRRKHWAEENLKTIIQTNGSDTISLLLEMVKLLGSDGMSSDESTGHPQKLCTVVRKNWRSPDVVRLLKWIDRNRPHHNVYGGPKAGNPPHRRLRLPYGRAPTTTRLPIAGLPVNFYNEVWYNGLTTGQKLRLGAGEPQELPLYVLTWPGNAALPNDKDDQDEY